MKKRTIIKDPLNLVIIGVAGQGNVAISILVCNALIEQGYFITFGQTYPSQQRGGSVINYIRISREVRYSPIIPNGKADIIVGMEPMETLRMLGQFGNPSVITLVNPRPIYSLDMLSSGNSYPNVDKVMDAIKRLSAKTLVVNATDEAQKIGGHIYANIVLTGALIGTGLLPLNREAMISLLKERFPTQFEVNIAAFDKGMKLVGELVKI